MKRAPSVRSRGGTALAGCVTLGPDFESPMSRGSTIGSPPYGQSGIQLKTETDFALDATVQEPALNSVVEAARRENPSALAG